MSEIIVYVHILDLEITIKAYLYVDVIDLEVSKLLLYPLDTILVNTIVCLS